jgi:excisionase family DNA binding protein
MTSTPTTTTTSAASDEASRATSFLKATEVARRLGVGKTSLYGWLARGDIASYRVGRLIRIKESDVEAFMSHHRVERSTPHTYERRPQS